MTTIYKAKWIVPISSPPVENGALAESNGIIAAAGTASDVQARLGESATAVRDFGDSILCPGFVNAHTHLELTLLRGAAEDLQFIDWLRTIVSRKRRLSAASLLASARWGLIEALRSGVTAVGDIVDRGASVEALVESGLRGIAFQEIYDLHSGEITLAIDRLFESLGNYRERLSSRLSLGISPHSPVTVSAGLLSRVAEISLADGMPIAIHAAESKQETAFLTEGGGEFASMLGAWRGRIEPPRLSPIEYLASLGFLSAHPLLIHTVQVSEREVDLIAESGCSVVHCPKSNLKLGHGIAPLSKMLSAGINVALGTDSMASNNACDLLDEARFALLMQRASNDPAMSITAARALEMATIGGAKALGIDRLTGSLEEGKQADFVVVSLREPGLVPTVSPETALVFSASARDVRLVAVGGEVLYEEGRFSRWNIDELEQDVRRAASEID